MKQLLFILSVTALLGVTSCKESNTNAINKTIPIAEYEQKLTNADIQLIDVRSTEEFNGGHLKNARNIDVNAGDFDEQVNTLKKDKPVLVYCLSGGRSADAAAKLKDMGFKEVYNMQGGIVAWNAQGKPLEKGAAPRATGMTIADLTEQVKKSTYVLVDFNATWCGPCKKMNPILDEIAESKKDKLSLLKIDADSNPELLNQKKIEGIPYLELYKDGQLVWKHEGYIEKDQLLKETQL